MLRPTLFIRRHFFLSHVFVFALLWPWVANETSAQHFMVKIDAVNDGSGPTQKLLESLKQAINFRYQQQAKEYKELLDLDDKRWRKLSIAAKGAATKALRKKSEKVVAVLRRYQRQAGIDVSLDDFNLADDEQQRKEKSSTGEAPEEIFRAFAFAISMPKIDSIETEPIWQKAISQVLTAEQVVRYDDRQRERELEFRKSLVEALMVSIRLGVFASDEQVEQLRQILDREVGEALVHHAKNPDSKTSNAIRMDRVAPTPRYSLAVFEILDSDQQQEWTRLIEPMLTPIVKAWDPNFLDAVEPKR
jgi:hypothetical protein